MVANGRRRLTAGAVAGWSLLLLAMSAVAASYGFVNLAGDRGDGAQGVPVGPTVAFAAGRLGIALGLLGVLVAAVMAVNAAADRRAERRRWSAR